MTVILSPSGAITDQNSQCQTPGRIRVLAPPRPPVLTYEPFLLVIRDAEQQLPVGIAGVRSHQLDQLLPAGLPNHKLLSLLFLQQVEGLDHLAALHVGEFTDLVLERALGVRRLQLPSPPSLTNKLICTAQRCKKRPRGMALDTEHSTVSVCRG